MNETLYKALISYFNGHISKHVANVKIHTSNTAGVAEHSDHVETIEKELDIISSYEDKLSVLKKYFGDGNKEVING
jgi:predicted AAA+ superfamily ATPase|tara:strand:+ start:1014 stop:1241 length:228 start_codon:yes stop_codon:yes gene_type:complete